MTRLAFVAYGQPRPQGSKVRTRYAMRDSNDEVLTPWRNTVSHAAHLAAADVERLDGPVTVRVTYYFDRPRSHWRSGRNAHLLRDDAPAYPLRVGDIDKLQRALLDSLTDAGVWHDDSQVVTVRAAKRWTSAAGPMQSPGAIVEVEPATP